MRNRVVVASEYCRNVSLHCNRNKMLESIVTVILISPEGMGQPGKLLCHFHETTYHFPLHFKFDLGMSVNKKCSTSLFECTRHCRIAVNRKSIENFSNQLVVNYWCDRFSRGFVNLEQLGAINFSMRTRYSQLLEVALPCSTYEYFPDAWGITFSFIHFFRQKCSWLFYLTLQFSNSKANMELTNLFIYFKFNNNKITKYHIFIFFLFLSLYKNKIEVYSLLLIVLEIKKYLVPYFLVSNLIF